MSGITSTSSAQSAPASVGDLPFSRLAAWGLGLALVVPLVGVVFSHIGLAAILGQRRRGMAVAASGLALNYVALILWPTAILVIVWLCFAAVATSFGASPGDYPGLREFWAPTFGS